jgi:hypothetical protein
MGGGGNRVEKCEKNGISGHGWHTEIKRDGVRKQCPKEPVSVPDWMGGKIKTHFLFLPCIHVWQESLMGLNKILYLRTVTY